jgi:LysR family hydrogen peroxide-inducible transcriptional activator
MNLRDIKYILAVADTRHFGRAAERCFVSQPTLSGQIRKLEDELGVTLFERTNRSVDITPIGAAHSGPCPPLAGTGRCHRTGRPRPSGPLDGPLRIGAIPTLSPYLMPLILVPLKRQYPQLRLVLSEELTESLLGRLQRHDLDAILIATPVEQPDLTVIPLFDEPFWLAHHRDHPLYTQDEITAQDLAEIDLLLLAEGHCLTHQVLEVCHLTERPQRGEMADLRAASLETLLQLVSAGFGCTLVPALAIRGSWMTDTGIVARRLELPMPSGASPWSSAAVFPGFRPWRPSPASSWTTCPIRCGAWRNREPPSLRPP